MPFGKFLVKIPEFLGLKGATDSTPIGNVGDSLKVHTTNSGSSEVKIKGDTDNTLIGNVGDSLKTIWDFPTEHVDTFARLKVSNAKPIFEGTHRFGDCPCRWQVDTSNGGTSTKVSNEPSMQMTVTGTNGSEVIRQTRRYMRYSPGKSQLFLFTGNLKGGKSGIRKRVGLFDSENGIYFELDGTTLNAVIRSNVSGSVVETKIPQSSWNIDKLNGLGNSGITLDTSKQLIYSISYQWLGAGFVQFGFFIGADFVPCHREFHSNILTTPYSYTGELPIRCEIKNISSGSGDSMKVTCFAVDSEGGSDETGAVRTVDAEVDPVYVDKDKYYPMIALRVNPAYRGIIKPLTYVLLTETDSDPIHYEVIYAGTVNASWTNVGIIGQYAIGEDITSFSGGYEPESGYIPGDSESQRQDNIASVSGIDLAVELDGSPTTWLLKAKASNGSNYIYPQAFFREYL